MPSLHRACEGCGIRWSLLMLPLLAPAWVAGVAVVDVAGTADQLVLRCAVDGYGVEPVTTGGQVFQRLRVAGEAVTLEAGTPQLPKVCRSVIIPDDARMTVRVLDAQYTEVPMRIAPSPGPAVDPAAVVGTPGGAYERNAFWPGELARLGEPYILRDHRGVVVELYPFQWNPVTETLRVYTELTVEVAASGPGIVNVLQRTGPRRASSRAFEGLYRRHFVNQRPAAPGPPLEEEGDLLIIAYDFWLSELQPLVDHKISAGIDTTLVGVSTIGATVPAIRSYIQDVYDTSDLAFVLLVGDAEQVPTPHVGGAPADPVYARVAGTDDYPDIMVGRFSAEDGGDVGIQVLRTIQYEQEHAPQQEWFWKGMGIGAAEMAGHLDGLRDDLLAHGYTHVDQLYDPGVTSAMVSDALDEGRGIVNYAGLGGTESWGTGGFGLFDITLLENRGMLPFIFSAASLNGAFEGGTCFAEGWLRAVHGSEPTGAIGAYMSSISQYWQPPLTAQEAFVELYTSQAHATLGTLCFAAGCQMIDEYGAVGVETFDTWILFGDPSLRVVEGGPGTVLYVDDDAPAGGDGTSWATAFRHLQDALSAAEASGGAVSEIRVGQGMYRPDQGEGYTAGDREATFRLQSGVALRGGYAGYRTDDPEARDAEACETVLSGDLAGDDGPEFENNEENSFTVVTGNGTDEAAVLDGFTVTAGNADNGLYEKRSGGGMYIKQGSPTVLCTTFTGNYADHGGAVYTKAATPLFTDCRFDGNRAEEGAGVHNDDASAPVLTRCTFTRHLAEHGGGMYNDSASRPVLTACTFRQNSTVATGGAMVNENGSAPLLVGCVLRVNEAAALGGALYSSSSQSALICCTLSDNTAAYGPGVVCSGTSHLVVVGSILWDGDAELYLGAGATAAVSYSDVHGGWPGEGNIDADPLFLDPDGPDGKPGTDDDDLRLAEGSPCVNAGSNYAEHLPDEDLDDQPRLQQCRVDMGAYESPHAPGTFADCNSNGLDDDCEIQEGSSQDCNLNHLPDECEDMTFEAVSVCSLLPHGDAGELCLELSPDGARIEPRMPGIRTLRLAMSSSADPATVTPEHVQVACSEAAYTGTVGVSLADGEYCADGILAMGFDPALPDQDCCAITLEGMTSVYGAPATGTVSGRTLAGDADRDGLVNSIDASAVKPRFGVAVDDSTLSYDLTADGLINSIDTAAVKPRFGHAAPDCP